MTEVIGQKAGSPSIQGSFPPFTFWSFGVFCLISLILTSKTFQT
jgi:hypothetical protein